MLYTIWRQTLDIRLGIEVTDTDLKQGTLATYNVLEGMRKSGVSKISFSSSSAVCMARLVKCQLQSPTVQHCRYHCMVLRLGSEALISQAHSEL